MKKTLKTLLASLLVLIMTASCYLAEVTLNEPGTYPVANEVVTYDAFVIPKSQIVDMEGNHMTQWLEAKTGVHFNWEMPPSSESTTRMNLRLTDEDQPDFYYGMNVSTSRIWELALEGIAMPLNDLIENYMPNLKKVLEENPALKTAITAPDGNIYAFPRTDGGIHNLVPQKVFVYTPWLEQLKIEVPSTPAEFEAYLQAVKDNDMNGNGDATDEIPLIINSGNLQHVLGFLLAPFEPQPNKKLNVEDGVLTPCFTSDAYREGLKWINSLCEKGLLAKDSFTLDQATVKGLTSRPDAMIVGASGGWFESSFGDMSVLTTLWEDYEAVPPLANADGVRRTINHNGDVAMNSFITTSCENPEALAMWCDFWFSFEGIMTNYLGVQGIHWDWVDIPSIAGDTPSARTLGEGSDGITAETWYGTGFRYQNPEIRYSQASGAGVLEVHYYNESLKYIDYLPEEYVPSQIWFEAEANEQVLELEGDLFSYVNECRAAFITGTMDIEDDATWNAYLEELEAYELQTWVELYQEAYDGMYK